MPETLRRLTMLLLLTAASLHAGAAEIAGLTFDDRIQLAGNELRLNGVGMRSVAWVKGYAAALYLSRQARDTSQALAAPGPKRVQMRMMLDVNADVFIKALRGGVEGNTGDAERARLADRMATFDHLMRSVGQVRKGDVVDLDYVPDRGLVFSLNGRAQGLPLPGEDLYAAVLKVFVGDRPVDHRLKAGLLGSA